MSHYSHLCEAWDSDKIKLGTTIGAIAGIGAGILYDYFTHNRKLNRIALQKKSEYISEHINDYNNSICRDQAISYLNDKTSHINELNELLEKKKDELYQLKQTVSIDTIEYLNDSQVTNCRYKIKKVDDEIKTVQKALSKELFERDNMKRLFLSNNIKEVRKLLVEDDAEKYAADYIRKNKSYFGKVIGGISGMSLGTLAAILLCLA